ncbi:hypothetical protein ACQY0O_004363 [Thecaphora frezii]
MPPDARSLFRAAASERRAAGNSGIQDPFASYNPSTRALRCSACNFVPVKHESLWASHASSKSHRANVAKIRAEREREALRTQEEEQRQRLTNKGKRKAYDGDQDDDDSHDAGTETDSKRAKVDGAASSGAADGRDGDVDPEWEAFQREIAKAESGPAPDPVQTAYANATIEVEPVIKGQEAPMQEGAERQEEPTTEEETEEQRRARREQEEREEIYSRYEEEQRIQDEAEERVTALKLKLERLKAARLAKKQQAKKGVAA